jgi:hypothetical protein
MSEWKENVDLRTIDDVIENLQGNIDEITLVNNGFFKFCKAAKNQICPELLNG